MASRLPKRIQTPKEERLNALSHGVGLLMALIFTPFLLSLAFGIGDFDLNLASISFCLGMILVYTSSTFYHLAKERRLKQKLQKADHISIYFLIAGSYSPLVLGILERDKALLFLGILWFLVILGTLFKLFFIGRFRFVSVALYLGMGWMSVIIFRSMWDKFPGDIIFWIALGGIFYTVGVFFYVQSKKLYYHAIWHLFVLGGTASHFAAIWLALENPALFS